MKKQIFWQHPFPPCMGGCIVVEMFVLPVSFVSSLYGRVYRLIIFTKSFLASFLPVWEGVSEKTVALLEQAYVSSLYGRVYRDTFTTPFSMICFLPVWEGVSKKWPEASRINKFPPCMGGCIVLSKLRHFLETVSSLYGRVYRCKNRTPGRIDGFLPVWEGVSDCQHIIFDAEMFPPCMGGCIGLIYRIAKVVLVSSLYGRVDRHQ